MNQLNKVINTIRAKGILSKERIPFFVLLVIMIFTIDLSYEHKRWDKDQIIQSDAVIYYGYLPSIISFQDLSLSYLDDESNKGMRIWYLETEDKKRFFKMSIGVSLLLSPFYIVAHTICHTLDLSTDGYNSVYYFFVVLASWVYAFLGFLLLIRSMRLLKINSIAIALSIAAIGLATNFIYYSALEVGLSHIFSFFLFAGILHSSILWNQKYSMSRAILIGVLLGLCIIVRPVNGLVIIIPFFYGIDSISSLKEKLITLWEKKGQVITMGIACMLVMFIQLLAWKIGTGKWIVYSYGDEGFFFNSPNLFNGLFSYRKGLFIYSPILLLTIPGVYFLLKKRKEISLTILLFISAMIYVIFSWWCWWYGGSFGMRSLIESYVFMAIPMALFFDVLIKKWRISVLFLSVLILLGVKLNFSMVNDYLTGKIHHDSMTKKSYYSMLFNQQVDDNSPMYNQPSYWNAMLGNSENEPYHDTLRSTDELFQTDVDKEFLNLMENVSRDSFFIKKYHHELVIECAVLSTELLTQNDEVFLVISMDSYEENKKIYESYPIEITEAEIGKKKKISFKASIEFTFDNHTEVKAYFWNKGRKKMEISDLVCHRFVY